MIIFNLRIILQCLPLNLLLVSLKFQVRDHCASSGKKKPAWSSAMRTMKSQFQTFSDPPLPSHLIKCERHMSLGFNEF